MIAAQDGSDRSACAASNFDYEDFVSVLMFYGHMSKDEIMNSSRKFLIAVYQKYVKRACENLGVPYENDPSTIDLREKQLDQSDYPSGFISYTQAQRKKEIAESGISDKDFLSQFPQYKEHKIVRC